MSTTIHLFTNGGVKLDIIDEYTSLDYGLLVNDSSRLNFILPAAVVPWTWWQRDCRLEVWRDVGKPMLMGETQFLLRRRRRFLDEQGREMVQIGADRSIQLLARRIVDYVAESAQSSKTAAADNMLKAIVRENLGSLATDTSRDWSRWLSVAADLGAVASLSKAFAYRVVLDVLKEIAEASAQGGAPLFFDIVKPSDVTDTLEFRTYTGQRGTDRSRSGLAPLVVSPTHNTLQSPSLDEDYAQEYSRVVAGGAGLKDQRTVQRANDTTRQGLTPFGLIERFTNSQGQNATNVLSDATALLRKGRSRRLFAGEITDTDGVRFGRDWVWGDKLIAQWDVDEVVCRVDAVQVSIDSSGVETVRAGLRSEDA